MTNEELALKIKAGDDSLQEELWLQVRKFITWQARRYCRKYADTQVSLGLQLEDFVQVGYFAMLKAIEAFPEDSEYKFLSYLTKHLIVQFNTILQRTYIPCKKTKLAKTHIERATSLDAQIGTDADGDSSNYTLHDTCPDQAATQAFEAIEDRLYLQQLRVDLDTALSELPKQQATCIRCHYLENDTYDYIAKVLNISRAYVQDLIRKGLLSLRRCTTLSEYRQNQLMRAYKGGIGAWKSTGSSIQEQIVINIDEQEQRLKALLQNLEDSSISAG